MKRITLMILVAILAAMAVAGATYAHAAYAHPGYEDSDGANAESTK